MSSDAIVWNIFDDSDLNGYTLVIPSVAVGNVGQLASDLLISSMETTKLCSIYSPALIPVVGHDPYNLNSSSISSSCEIYKCAAKNVCVLQLRAPLVFKYAQAFLEEIVLKFKAKNVKDIIILTSSFAHEKKHILTSPFRYIANEVYPYKSKLEKLKWMEHEFVSEQVRIYGSGFASLLYVICKEKNVPCLLLYKYCSEGDNIPDAYDMIQQLVQVLPVFDAINLHTQLVPPASWNLLFGRPPPTDIY